MAKESATVSELRNAAEVTDQEIDAAVDTVLADLATDGPARRRKMVRTAILLANLVKG